MKLWNWGNSRALQHQQQTLTLASPSRLLYWSLCFSDSNVLHLSGGLASRHLLWLPQEAFPPTTRTFTWRSLDWGSGWLYSACLLWVPEPVLCSVSSRLQWQRIKVMAQSQILDPHPSLKTTKSLVDTVCLPARLHCLLPGIVYICTCPTAIYFRGHASHLLREAAWSRLTQPHL